MNKTMLKGRICSDIDIQFTQTNNKKIAKFRIAVRRDYKNQNGEYDTDFFNVSAFGNSAEFLEKYFSKGQEILIIGHLQNNQWETENGEKRTMTNIIVESVEFCGNKQNNTESNNNFESTMQQNGVQVNTINDNNDLPF